MVIVQSLRKSADVLREARALLTSTLSITLLLESRELRLVITGDAASSYGFLKSLSEVPLSSVICVAAFRILWGVVRRFGKRLGSPPLCICSADRQPEHRPAP